MTLTLTRRIAVVAAACTLAAGLGAAPARADHTSTAPERHVRIEALRMACHRTAEAKVIHCEWRDPKSPDATKVTLFVQVNNRPRHALITLEPAAAGGFDFTVPAGAERLRFALVSFDAAGKVDGRSRVHVFFVGRPAR
jgi:hypothetical protein